MKYSSHRPNIFNAFDELFFNNSGWSQMSHNHPSVNIKETNDHFLIEVAAPGLSKEQFHIEIEQDQLVISAKREENKVEKKDQYMRREFSTSSFRRSFHVDHTIDTEGIDATYVDGILAVILPKKEEVKIEAKKIEIK